MRGFSLVELSIVLVILGLLTGGILSGQSLIRAAEIRSVISDFQRYHAAYYTFRDRYMAIPGDMATATQFWGIAGGANGTGSACFTVDSSTLPDPRATCNGNGDGAPWLTAGGGGTPWTNGERFRAWQHLANAGLIEGSYTGRTDSITSSWVVTIGKNVPVMRIGSSHLAFGNANYPNGHANVFVGVPINSNLLEFDVLTAPAGQYYSPLLPEETWNVDTKLDDGKPAYGRLRSARRGSTYAPNCTTSNDPATAEYDMQSKANCYVWYLLD